VRWPRRNVIIGASAARRGDRAGGGPGHRAAWQSNSGQAGPNGFARAPTVVIQYTKVRTSHFREAGIRPPYAESTGAGTRLVFRGGQAYAIRWSRPDANGGTTFITTSGQPMTFAGGPVWIVLAATP
jgi:Protein of unknown function (DUF3048) C-terminal domain